ncbi:MAG: GntP family permease, partial [Lachnospiraceae bacterium]|nr:GntP family permease [Lachnospiraceae bacterium]
MLMVIFIISIAVLLFCIMKLKLNAFVALLAVAVGTGIACGMPLMTSTIDGTTVEGIGTIIQNNFGSTLGSIGMVTGLGVILGMFMYESGGINNICNAILRTLGTDKSHFAAAFAGFITGIPVFGDVVYIMFAPMLRAMSKKSGYSMAAYGGILAVATTCTFALVLPTAPPLAVAANMGINVGLFFPYALIA